LQQQQQQGKQKTYNQLIKLASRVAYQAAKDDLHNVGS
jgi:hypothetical protein